MSPLAGRIYRVLLRQVGLVNPLIAYGDLIRALGPLPPPNEALAANDQRLFDALDEIICACQRNDPPLPILTSLVVRRDAHGTLGIPGGGYFTRVFPHVADEKTRLRLWNDEVRRVVAFSYPTTLTPTVASSAQVSREAPRWLKEPTVLAAIIGLVGTILTVLVTVIVTFARRDPPQPTQTVEARIANAPLSTEPAEAKQVDLRENQRPPRVQTLDGILDSLERNHQRATFGAVAEFLGREPRSLFNGYPRTPRTSWVVSKSTGLPTGTKESDYPPALFENKRVIDSSDELRAWLKDHP